jgi:hypothetical protein
MKVFLVDEIEFEAGWGARREDQYLFPSEELAIEFAESYNREHNSKLVNPEWYMRQDYIGEVDVNETQFEAKKYKGNRVVMPKNWTFVS